MQQNINKYVHDVLEAHMNPTMNVIDATCGNGHDTIFLAARVAKVHAFDIQEQAIQSTYEKVLSNEFTNVTMYHQSHDTFTSIFEPQSVDVVVYNLGYLPSSDHRIITTPETTVSSITQALDILKIGGLISITVYTGHEGGTLEATAVEHFLQTLDKHQYTIQKISYLNRHQSPYVIFIQKEN